MANPFLYILRQVTTSGHRQEKPSPPFPATPISPRDGAFLRDPAAL